MKERAEKKSALVVSGVAVKSTCSYVKAQNVISNTKGGGTVVGTAQNLTAIKAGTSTFKRAISSKNTWLMAAAISTAEICLLLPDFWKNKIDFETFAMRASLKVVGTTISTVGAIGGSAAGAIIGTAFWPGIGTIAG
jgi:hypothetical protein